MNGRRSVRRSPGQQAQVVEDTSDSCNNNPSGSSGSSGIPEKRWHLRNSKSSMSSSSQPTVDDGEENGETICSFPGLMLLVIFCIPKYILQTCISIKDKLTMKNLIITVLITCGAIFYFCQYLKSRDVFASKELAQLYEAELKSLWKSQKALEEQVQEIQHLKNQTEHLRAEISSINKGILNSVKQILSESDIPGENKDPDVYPGNCWAFHGSQGQVVIKLPEKIQPTAVTVQHISRTVAPLKEVTSAMKDFSVYGIDNETDEETLLGTFMYDIEKETIQTFQLQASVSFGLFPPLSPFQNEAAKPFLYIKFKVQSNWGNIKFTCIYRVRVHGKMAEYLVSSEEVQG
ncbi:hypothetical protein JD844_009438 [Phrynosoma platyrhinos]|uniref:SUN domain-containing protein n=1 Tax=Phrynosoma platyrhinos TaxID=52577 RepID=A0ABQ7TFG2_PHRPL|nr:hypothetical protein JD844_009438 [Phrynosoma platyrhinos]